MTSAASPIVSLIAKLETYASDADVLQVLAAGLEPLGIEFVLYIAQTEGGGARLMASVEDWATRHFENAEDEPFLRYSCGSYASTFTGIEFVTDYPYLEARERAYIQAAAQSGFRSGLGIPVRLTTNERVAAFNFGTRLSKADFLATISPLEPELRALAFAAHRHLDELQASRDSGDSILSAREHSVIELLSRGLRVAAIAHELDLSEAAIRLYLRNARNKLNARTPEQAIAQAVHLGFIEVEEH